MPSVAGMSARRTVSPIAIPLTSSSRWSGISIGSPSTLISRFTYELDRDLRLDRLIEPDLVEVDVRETAARHFLLVVLQHRGMRRLLAVEDDVEDRMRAGVAGEHAPKLALVHAERVRRLAAPVEDTGDEALLPQAPGIGGAARLTLLNLESNPLTGHGGRV